MSGKIKSIFSKTKLKEISFILIGTLLMALAINFVLDPMGMVSGGVTGLAIIIKDLSVRIGISQNGIPVWAINICLNAPLFITAFYKKGFKYIAKTLFATLSLSAWIGIVPVVRLFDDYMIGALIGGVATGAGIGMVLATHATTGGTDLFASLLKDKMKSYSIPQILMVIDGTIVLMGAVVFGINNAIYAVIVVYLTSKISDGILDGLKFAKMAYIISDKADIIASKIMKELDRGVTGCNVTGMYSGESRQMLYCVVSRKEMTEVLEIVHSIDPGAFLVVNDVREVMGEGFGNFPQQ